MAALALVVTGPLVGVELAIAAFTNPIVARLPDDAFRAARSDASRLLGRVMPWWYITALVLLVLAASASRTGPIGAAAGLMAVVVLLTVTALVPINNRIARWSPADGPSRALAARWDRLHWLRVVVLAVLLVLLVAGAG